MLGEKEASICRICLSSEQNNIKSLQENYREFRIIEYINKITRLNMQVENGLPSKICDFCFTEFETANNFIEKCIKSDNVLKSYSDNACEFTNLFVKVELDQSDSEFKTEEDNELYFVSERQEDGHLVECERTNFTKSKFECHDCGETFKSKCKIRVHWKNTHMLNSLVCKHCQRSFKSYKAFNIHAKSKSKSCIIASNPNVKIEGMGKAREFHCKECIYKTKRIKDMAVHLRTHSGEKPYQCNMCPKRYSQMGSLQAHKETFHKKYLVETTCQYCGKLIKGRVAAYRHLKTHREGKTQCTVCMKSVSKRNFYLHMRRHTGLKTYTCEKCASTFYTSGELCNHKRWVHKKTDLFKCSLCDYKTIKKHLVKRHQVKHTDKNIPCTVCGMFFLTQQKLTTHQRRHFDERNFACPQCNKKFLTRDSVRKHMMNKHLNVVDQKNNRKMSDVS